MLSALCTGRREPGPGTLVILGRIDVLQKVWRELEDDHFVTVAIQDGPRTLRQGSQVGKQRSAEQVRRSGDLAVSNTDNRLVWLPAIGIEQRPVLPAGHERLVAKREHG